MDLTDHKEVQNFCFAWLVRGRNGMEKEIENKTLYIETLLTGNHVYVKDPDMDQSKRGFEIQLMKV